MVGAQLDVEREVADQELVVLPINNSVTLGKIFPSCVFNFSRNGKNSYSCFLRFLST